MLNSQESEQIRQELIKHIETNFPEDKKEAAIKQIRLMEGEHLEKFLKENNLEQNCIFCSIASGKANSYKIDETDDAVAVLEINPISKGHTLVITKKHLSIDKLPKDIYFFVDKIADKIKKKFKPKDIVISTVDFGGHGIINILPVFDSENIKSKRHKADEKELQEIIEILNSPEKKSVKKKEKVKPVKNEKLWLPKRIP